MKKCPYPELPKCRHCIAWRYRARGEWQDCEGCYIDAFRDRKTAATCRLMATQYLIRCWDEVRFRDVTHDLGEGHRFVESVQASMKHVEKWTARLAKLSKLKSPTELRQVMCDLMTEYYGNQKAANAWYRILRFRDDPLSSEYVPSKHPIV